MNWLTPVTLVGKRLRLESAEDRHYEGLCQSADSQTFEYFSSCPSSWDSQGFKDWFESRTTPPFLCMAMIDQSSETVVGSSTFFDASQLHRHLEVGYTWISPNLRGSWVNPEAKLLMLQHAFESLDCVRVQLKCDVRNERSKAAIRKLGAKFEGVHRHNMVLDGGRLRDTAYFSILKSEWPEVRGRLVERVESF